MSSKISELPAVVAANLLDADVFAAVAGGITSKVAISDLRTKLGLVVPAGRTVAGPAYVANNAVYNAKDFGAVFDGSSHPLSGYFGTLGAAQILYPHATSLTNEIDWAATQLAINLATRGGKIVFPQGTGIFNKTVTIVVDGIAVEGQGGHTAGALATKPTALDFSTLATGLDAITAIGPGAGTMKQIKFKRFYVEMLAPSGQIGGAAIKCQNCSGVNVKDVAVYVPRGATSYGIQFGHLTDGTKAVIASSIDTVTSVSDGTPFLVGTGSTSVHGRASYALGHSTAGWYFKGSSYCSLNACAADTGTSTGYGYMCEATNGIGINGCGAENNGKGFFKGIADIDTVIQAGRGVGNNTSADAAIGSFAELTGIGYGTKITACNDTTPNAATTLSIRGGAGRLGCDIDAYLDGVSGNYPKGIGGDATFILLWLTLGSGSFMTVPALTVNRAAAFGLVSTNGQTELITGFAAAGGNTLVATLNANRTAAAPTGMVVGQRVTFTIIQDGVGGRTLAWNAVFKVSWSDVGNTLNKRSSISFIWDGTNWNQDGAQTPYV